ncbi:MAG TPA: hypothetical protein VF811_14160 [Parasulfuritortus sp.]
MDKLEREDRTPVLAERSSHIENILQHAFLFELGSHVWRQDPRERLTILKAEVDDAGYDLIVERDVMIRRIQLKQAHDGKTPKSFSFRVEFAMHPGACIVVIHYSMRDLRPTSYSFFGQGLEEEMPYVGPERVTYAPGRRTASGEKVVRTKYRDAPFSQFKQNLSMGELLDELFPTDALRLYD